MNTIRACVFYLAIAFVPAAAVEAVEPVAPELLPSLVVTPTGREQSDTEVAPSLSLIDRDAIEALRAIHPSELRVGAPGLWISRGSGQEHLMALRSPVLTGAGACGAFLYLDNGVPVRPAGLCNVNQLFEINLEQADAIEVLRGPGPVLHGSNALHGVVHARSVARDAFAVEQMGGPDDYLRTTVDVGATRSGHTLRAKLLAAHDGGFRADSGYGMGKLNLDLATRRGETRVDAHFAATLLNQETAGFVQGRDAYTVPALARANANPQAYRDAQAQRLSVTIDTPRGGIFRPYLRRSSMEFLQHFLPGEPTEYNGQRSAGLKWQHTLDAAGGPWRVGADVEWADIELRETQARPVAIDSAFLRATRPVGAHYDFDVRALSAALFTDHDVFVSERTLVTAGARLDVTAYRYRTALEPGNNDANGNPCGFGGCLFSRPENRSDRFTNFAPKLQWSYGFHPQHRIFASLRRGFRAPQVTELYRLQSGQDVADLSSETLDSLDLGWRGYGNGARASVTAFAAIKRDLILRDANGFYVSSGKTSHYGIELDGAVALAPWLTLAGSATVARHRYRFERNDPGSEPIRRGDDVDTAPSTLGSLRLVLRPTPATRVIGEWEHMGSYFIDAANERKYGGHDLLHAVVETRWRDVTVSFKLRNVLDRAYAERADFAFGSYRYFPGQPRSLFVGLRYSPQ